MEARQLDDSKVDEIIKRAEREGAARRAAIKSGNYNPDKEENSALKITAIVIAILVIVSLIQSAEIISLKKQMLQGQCSGGK